MTLFNYPHMQSALHLAACAANDGEVPVGAVITDANGGVVAQNHNRMRHLCDPSAHAEMLALRHVCAEHGGRLPKGFSLWVTLEPCPMCAQALSFARISRIYYGAYDIKGGGVEHGARVYEQSSCFHQPSVYGGIMERECTQQLKQFFKARRQGVVSFDADVYSVSPISDRNIICKST